MTAQTATATAVHDGDDDGDDRSGKRGSDGLTLTLAGLTTRP